MKRVLGIVVVVGAIAAAAGVLLGHSFWAQAARTATTASRGFDVVSSWRSPGPATEGQGRIWIRTGAAADAPNWGAVLFSESDKVFSGGGKKHHVEVQSPTLLVAPHQTGALRIVGVNMEPKSPGRSLLLRSSRGWLYSLQWESLLSRPTLYELGRKLDPSHLPKLTPRGIAVAMTYLRNNREHHAILLVGLHSEFREAVPGPVYGYLDGYALSKPAGPTALLERPLLGPSGALYRLDAARRRVVRFGAPSATRRQWDPWNPLYSRHCRSTMCLRRRGPSIPSPNGRRVIEVRQLLSCPSETSYVASSQHRQRTALPVGDGRSNSLPLGWIDNRNLLYVAYDQPDCGDRALGQIELANVPPGPYSFPVVGTNGYDATLWGG